jgi:hypothetical protein
VLGAVLGAGLRLEVFNEHDYTLFPRWPQLEVDRDALEVGDVYGPPAGFPRLPLIYSLKARHD